jgi:geranylgeranyl diphosphate synthase, type II
MDVTQYLQAHKTLVDQALATACDSAHGMPPRLVEAMRYSLMAGGKRIRPALVFAGAECVGGTAADVVPCACALEMIHTFSLIHDDLPAMDDDDLRRGQPTNHKMFGEAAAVLSGDGLLAEAFWSLTDPAWVAKIGAARVLETLRDIAEATGGRGMVGGQLLDIDGESQPLTESDVTTLHRQKTGALIAVAVRSGARLAGASTEQLDLLGRFGAAAGLAFQIADDLLSLESTAEQLGKPVGNDVAREKSTYPAVVGREAARAKMTQLTAEAIECLQSFHDRAEPLRALATFITARSL